MSKTKEELEQLKDEYKRLTEQAKELTDEELENVSGGCSSTYSSETYASICAFPSKTHGQENFYHPLITTIGNSCKLANGGSTCYGCCYRFSSGLVGEVNYCRARSKEHDPGK